MDHIIFEKPPEVDPKLVTKMMLLNSNIFRKRNSNVSPLQTNRNISYRAQSPKRTTCSKYLPM